MFIHASRPGVMKIVRLAALSPLQQLDPDQLAHVAAHAAERIIPAGRRFLADGPLASELAVVAAGRGIARCAGETLADVGPGDVLGALSPKRPPHATVTVTAATDLRLVAFSDGALARLAASAPGAAAALLAACAVPAAARADGPTAARPPAHPSQLRDRAA
jgi:CRP-like cAMP-binding protein